MLYRSNGHEKIKQYNNNNDNTYIIVCNHDIITQNAEVSRAGGVIEAIGGVCETRAAVQDSSPVYVIIAEFHTMLVVPIILCCFQNTRDTNVTSYATMSSDTNT